MKKEDGAEAARAAGRLEGEMLARLGEHDARFRAMEESIAKAALATADLALHLQQLSDGRKADQELAVRTTEAVREATAARAAVTEDRAKQSARRQSVIVTCAVVGSAVISLLALLYSAHVL